MKSFVSNKLIHKIIIVLTIVTSLCFITPNKTYAVEWGDLGGKILKEVTQFIAAVGDVVMGAMNKLMLGAESMNSAMLTMDVAKHNAEDTPGSALDPDGVQNPTVITIENAEIDEGGVFGGDRSVPNMLYSPEAIFSNNIGMLDVNFLNPNTYYSVKEENEEVIYDENEDIGKQDKQVSSASILGPTIASWYKAFRNIAIVGLLTVLVYLGIKILISSTASDKAKYKESLKDWFIALCLVFAIHFIMAGILTLINQVNYLFDDSANNIVVDFQGSGDDKIKFRTNLIGLVRFRGQSTEWQDAVAYCIIYFVLVIYTIIFTFQYLKRLLYMAFFTMIAPLVALTYPIDKVGDGKAQAFNMWFKEYTVNAMIQPIHLLLYTALVSSAISLASANPIYAIVAIGFMIPAEKFIKKMFKVESETASGIGSFAGGALAMTGLQQLARLGKSGVSKAVSGGKANSSGDSEETGSNVKFSKSLLGNDMKDYSKLDSGSQDEPKNDEHSKLLQTRDRNQALANQTENESKSKRERDKESVEELNKKMREKGYLKPEDGNTLQQNKDAIQNQTKRNKLKKYMGKKKNYYLKRAKRMAPIALKAAKGTAKTALKLAGGATGAAIGFASGVAQGDPSKAFTNMALGAVAGGTIGSNAYNLVEDAGNAVVNDIPEGIQRWNDEKEDDRNEAEYGRAYAYQKRIERENARARAKFLNDSKEREKWEDIAGKIGFNGDMRKFMGYVADYKEVGITDDKLIQRSLKKEKEYGDGEIGGTGHGGVVGISREVQDKKIDREYIENLENQKALYDEFYKKLKNHKLANRAMRDVGDIVGAPELIKTWH